MIDIILNNQSKKCNDHLTAYQLKKTLFPKRKNWFVTATNEE